MRRCLAMVVLACAGVFAVAGGASARREHAFSYPYVRVWETAVRLLRVDFESPIGEKNREDGYFLFEYPYQGKGYPGSVQVVRAGDNRVRVVVQVPAMPSYVEQMILDKLERKLTDEYGAPPERVGPAATPATAKPEPKSAPSETKPASDKPAK